MLNPIHKNARGEYRYANIPPTARAEQVGELKCLCAMFGFGLTCVRYAMVTC